MLHVALAKPHRYRRYRAVTMAITLAVLFLVPLSGTARVDLLGGGHWALGVPVGMAKGLVAVLVAIVSFYIVTFLINIPAGRMFCGFGCPIGQLSRLSDAVDAFEREPKRRRGAWLRLIAFAAVLSFATLLWWVAPQAFIATAPRTVALAFAALASVTLAAVVHARWWRWQFCRQVCPIGLYYSVVQTTALIGIDFDRDAPCTDCKACEIICPVQLDPRHLEDPIPSPGGLAFDGLAAANHCLHCGDCVEICEHQTRKTPGHPPMGFRMPSNAKRSNASRSQDASRD